MTNHYYFAYGMNMDEKDMGQRCPRAVLVSIGKLRGYRFIINARGIATVIPEPSEDVYGVLWTLTKSDEEALDDYEGVSRGMYVKMMVDVQMASKALVRSIIYTASCSTPGSPQNDYIRKILSNAQLHGLPKKYLEELATWLRTEV